MSLVGSCRSKCIPSKYKDGTLTKGEAVCIDRCAEKYFSALESVSQTLGTLNQKP